MFSQAERTLELARPHYGMLKKKDEGFWIKDELKWAILALAELPLGFGHVPFRSRIRRELSLDANESGIGDA